MNQWSAEEKEYISLWLYGLLNDPSVNEWEHDFLLSIAERKQVTFTDKQKDKIKAIAAKCASYEYARFITLVVDSGLK